MMTEEYTFLYLYLLEGRWFNNFIRASKNKGKRGKRLTKYMVGVQRKSNNWKVYQRTNMWRDDWKEKIEK